MATAKTQLSLDKYDLGTFEQVIEKLDDTGSIFNGTLEINAHRLTVEYDEPVGLHRITGVLAL